MTSRHFKIRSLTTGKDIPFRDIPIPLRDQLTEEGFFQDPSEADRAARLKRMGLRPRFNLCPHYDKIPDPLDK